jgi:2-isopropylmalate synthase
VRLRVGKSETVSSDNVTGDGPVDAIYRSIDHAIGRPFNLHSYQLRSITEGQDALGEVLVQISFAGRLFTGRATSTDILRASAEAYIDAINHVETHRAGDQYVIGAIMDAYTYGPEEKW